MIRLDPCTRRLVACSLAAGLLSVPFILHFTGYPFAPHIYWVFEYHLRTEDIVGALLLVGLVIAACAIPLNGAARLAELLGRHPWRVAAASFALLCLGALFVQLNHPVVQDEYAALFQSRVFAAGRITGQFPPELVGRLIPPDYVNQFLFASLQTGSVASAYWPGFALLLAPFAFLQVPWACNPLLAALSLPLMAALARKLGGDARAGGWAMLLALASPAFAATAITYYSMTAHLLLNLVFVWLLLERTPARLVAAGVLGSFALVLHNPLPHTLFALPWIVWLARGPQRWRTLGALAAGYAPLLAILGFGWAYLLSSLQGNALHGLYPADTDAFHRIANFFWGWHIKIRTVLADSAADALATRLAELVRLWNWAIPGLPLLALAGWWLARRDERVLLLGLSFLCTIAGYFVIGYNQGHGWGARYLHPAWAALPVLGAVALGRAREVGCEDLQRYVAALAILSLAFATALRATQIHAYVEARLAQRPPVAQGLRQIVFVHYDPRAYTADLVQNDPFLREKVWFMLSRGPERDAALVQARFPGARKLSSDSRGEVWALE